MNAKKHLFLASMLLSASALSFTSCDDDDSWSDVDGAKPSIALTSDHMFAETGRSITISGKVTDADGIASIGLVCHPLNLNKTINLIEIYGEPLKEYDLDYKFNVIQEPESDVDIEVTITDIGGRTDVQNVRLSLGDYSAPVFTTAPGEEITVLIKDVTTFKLAFSVQDNRVIDYVEVDLKDITAGANVPKPVEGFPMRIDGEGKKSIEFSKRLPLANTEAKLQATIKAYDKAAQDPAHETAVTSIVTVKKLAGDAPVYLSDVKAAAELNSDVFGVPTICDNVGPYKYRIRYYNEKAGTEICFLGQKTDFGPICFAPDKSDASILGDDPDEVNRIVLDKAGVYYVFDINTLTREFKYSDYPVSEAVNPVMHMHYGQSDLNTWWETNPDKDGDIWWQDWFFGPADGPGGVQRMTQDAKNPNIFIYEGWKLSEGEEMNFMIHNWHSHGWWNFTAWRVDDSASPSKFMYYGNHIPATSHYSSNDDYFQFKYVNADKEEMEYMYPSVNGVFDLGKWGDENYRKNFVPDNWVKSVVSATGTYNFIFDAHTERAKLVPAN